MRLGQRGFCSDAWGVKYDEECAKFEEEWQLIAEDKEGKQRAALDEELNEQQKAKVEMIVDKTLDLNVMEMRYMSLLVKDRVKRTTGINPLKLNMDWPSIRQDADGTWPPLNPNWFKQQDLMA